MTQLVIIFTADPIGKPIAPVQELRNQANDLGIETFEHSIPETFADSEVLDFDKYQNSTAEPGSVYPVKAPMGRSVSDSFHSLKTATLTDEIDSFVSRLDADGQFVLGDFPSIYGGPAQSGSKTAREYLESRAVALQRLGLTWTMLKFWWAKVMATSVTLFIKELKEDEKYSVPSSVGSTDYVNVWIRQHELTGTSRPSRT